MPRWFNTAGPCVPADHYMVPVLRRLPAVRDLIDRKAYFVVHAPRQIGKTTTLDALAPELTAEGRYAAVLVSMEVGAAFPDDTGAAELAILDACRRAADFGLPGELHPPPWPEAPPGTRLGAALEVWSQASPRPLVLFLDEIDALTGTVLISVLRQLRDGYRRRPSAFPWSLGLVGLRDVRDYLAAPPGSDADRGRHLGTASPFNIKVRSLTLRNFTADEVAELYAQHTADTGQLFTSDACARAYELTQGQPWLVNALAREAVEELVTDRSHPITAADVDDAKEALIRRQDTHLESLAERLREARVMDLLLTYRGDRLAIELKVWRDGEADPRPEGLAQLDRYLDGLGLDTGWLVLFDRRSGQPRIAQRTSAETVASPRGREITVIRA